MNQIARPLAFALLVSTPLLGGAASARAATVLGTLTCEDATQSSTLTISSLPDLSAQVRLTRAGTDQAWSGTYHQIQSGTFAVVYRYDLGTGAPKLLVSQHQTFGRGGPIGCGRAGCDPGGLSRISASVELDGVESFYDCQNADQ